MQVYSCLIDVPQGCIQAKTLLYSVVTLDAPSISNSFMFLKKRSENLVGSQAFKSLDLRKKQLCSVVVTLCLHIIDKHKSTTFDQRLSCSCAIHARRIELDLSNHGILTK